MLTRPSRVVMWMLIVDGVRIRAMEGSMMVFMLSRFDESAMDGAQIKGETDLRWKKERMKICLLWHGQVHVHDFFYILTSSVLSPPPFLLPFFFPFNPLPLIFPFFLFPLSGIFNLKFYLWIFINNLDFPFFIISGNFKKLNYLFYYFLSLSHSVHIFFIYFIFLSLFFFLDHYTINFFI